ncbi:hypothetical protein F4803DRAFT_545179 [Xylaria telfairii]|nr:hypothetical protein F4803DRAFT_545179 [Xylaria telfairii]
MDQWWPRVREVLIVATTKIWGSGRKDYREINSTSWLIRTESRDGRSGAAQLIRDIVLYLRLFYYKGLLG